MEILPIFGKELYSRLVKKYGYLEMPPNVSVLDILYIKFAYFKDVYKYYDELLDQVTIKIMNRLLTKEEYHVIECISMPFVFVEQKKNYFNIFRNLSVKYAIIHIYLPWGVV